MVNEIDFKIVGLFILFNRISGLKKKTANLLLNLIL